MPSQSHSRRNFLTWVGAVGVSKALFPGWMPRLAFRQSPPGDVLICIFLRGGIDGLNVVVPFGEGANYYDARPTQFVPEPGSSPQAAVDLDGFFGFHPALAALKEIFDDGNLTVIHAAGSTDPTRSHFDAMKFMEFGTPGNKTVGTGWLGRHLQSASWQNDSPFRAVGMGAMIQDALRGQNIAPLSIRSFAEFHLKGRVDELRRIHDSLSQLYQIEAPTGVLDQQAGLVFETVEMLKGLTATNYEPAAGATYPDNDFGLGLRQIAQLIKAEVGLEVACVDLDGWDTHDTQGTLDGWFNELLTTLGQGLAALYADLGDKMQSVTVVTMSEFGRRVLENASSGTDHGHGNIMMVMGGGVTGRQVFSRWPSLAPEYLDNGDLAITTDYRDVLAEIIQHRLLNPALDQVFPNHRISPLGLMIPR